MVWAEKIICTCGGKIEIPSRMILDHEAQGKFFDWRNRLYSYKDQLPGQLRGFLPKAVEYVLRFTGAIHCMQMFSFDRTPQAILTIEDLERGIKALSFYLGQIQGALQLIEEDDYTPPEISERSLLLAQTLECLRPHLHDGRLAIGFIHKHYNASVPGTQQVKTPKGMGAVLRAAKLNFALGKHNANGYRSVSCLEWDKATETFIEQCLQCLRRPKTMNWHSFDDEDIEDAMSATSAEQEGNEDLADIEETMPRAESFTSGGQTDIADLADDIREVQF
jgi:hypothetical protein